MNLKLWLLLFTIWLKLSVVYAEITLSPLQYGLANAKTGIERYWVLYKTHVEAAQTNAAVSYYGIDDLWIEIPENAEPIPLSDHTDFCNTRLYIKNVAKDVFLFIRSKKNTDISVHQSLIDCGEFNDISQLSNGLSFLVIEDINPWVAKRVGKNHGHTRKDLIVVKSGKAVNLPISSYNNISTMPKTTFCLVNDRIKKIQNLQLFRCKGNTKIVNFLLLENQYNVRISNINIITPEDTLANDHLFYLRNCSKVSYDNVEINGTYSRNNLSGYGIYMDTVYDICFDNLRAHGNWGIFGTVNVNKVELRNCDINRFDIHCYGRDVHFEKCIFRNLRNSFSSIMGKVLFEKCEFIDFLPFGFRGDYNAFTPFHLIIKDCKFRVNNSKHSLIGARSLLELQPNDRQELSKVCWPDVTIDGLTIIREDGYKGKVFLFELGHSSKKRELMTIPSEISITHIIDDGEEDSHKFYLKN